MEEGKREMIKQIIILFIVLIALISLSAYVLIKIGYFEEKLFSHNNVTLSQKDYDAIQDSFSNYLNVRVCNLENKNCILLTKMTYSHTLKGGVS